MFSGPLLPTTPFYREVTEKPSAGLASGSALIQKQRQARFVSFRHHPVDFGEDDGVMIPPGF